jgi:hypothetical protein
LRTVRTADFVAQVHVQKLELPVYVGLAPQSRWGKPVVGPPACPFAELQVAADLRAAGWTAAWVYRPRRFLLSWEPRSYAELPPDALKLHHNIRTRAGAQAGCWDIFAWRAHEPLFVELKRAGSSDRLRKPQLLWREAALELGIRAASFLIAEWSVGSIN